MNHFAIYLYMWVYSTSINCLLNCLIVFGDSLSDTGNLSDLTYGVLPGSRYYNGRFSNGKIWVDYIKEKFDIKRVENYAYGAASTDKTTSSWKFVPSIRDQISRYSKNFKTSCGVDKENYLVSYMGGANDYKNITRSPFDIVSNIEKDLTILIKDYGFEQILVSSLPALYLTPNIILSGTQSLNSIKSRIFVHNSLLLRLISKLSKLYPNVNLGLFEFGPDFSSLSPWYHNRLPDGDTSCCFNENEEPDPCINPDDFFFYDTFHPTTKAHFALSEALAIKFNLHLSQRCPFTRSSFQVFQDNIIFK